MTVMTHDAYRVQAGDDWAIGGLLQNLDGSPLDLTGADVRWILIGPDGAPALTPDQYTVDIEYPPTAGQIIITVPAAATYGLLPARYMDALKVVAVNGRQATLWEGFFDVQANPFNQFAWPVTAQFDITASLSAAL